MSNLVHNERVKYAATFVNNIGVAAFAIGGALPILNATPDYPLPIFAAAILFGVVCLFSSYYLLGGLKE